MRIWAREGSETCLCDALIRIINSEICHTQSAVSKSEILVPSKWRGKGKGTRKAPSLWLFFAFLLIFSFEWAHRRTEITNIYSRLCMDSFVSTRVNTSVLRFHAICDLDMRSCKILYQVVNLDILFLCYLMIDRVSSADLTSISSWDGCQISQLYYYPMACSQKLFNNYDNFRESCLCVTVHISS